MLSKYLKVIFIFIFFNISIASATISQLTFSDTTASFVDYGTATSAAPAPTPTGTNTPTSGSIPIVYGGMAGAEINCVTGTGPSAGVVCNNCTADLSPCNEKRIYGDLELQVEFRTDRADLIAAGAKIIYTVSAPGSTSATPLIPEVVPVTLAANTPLVVKIKWSSLCAAIGAGNCNTDKAATTINIGIDSKSDNSLDDSISFQVAVVGNSYQANSAYTYHSNCKDAAPGGIDEGFCYFWLYKGDKKAHIKDSKQSDTYNIAPGSSKYRNVRFYYNQGSSTTCDVNAFKSVTPISKYVDIATNNNGGQYYLKQSYIPNLDNYTLYYFRMANVDVAGNVFYFSSATGDSSTASMPGGVVLNCVDHSVVPEEVVGLLDGQSCFIATAAFGSPLAKELDVLREFRNHYLLPYSWGKSFVKWYYGWSPDAADWLRSQKFFRNLVKWALWPVVGLARFTLWSGLPGLIVFLILGLVMTLLLLKNVKRRRSKSV